MSCFENSSTTKSYETRLLCASRHRFSGSLECCVVLLQVGGAVALLGRRGLTHCPKRKLSLSALSKYSTASMDAFLQMPSYCIAPDWQFVLGLANFAQRHFAMKQKMLGSRR